MKVVTCFLPGTIREETLDALVKHCKDIHLINLKLDDPAAYGYEIGKLWKRGESFAIVEPDIVIREDVADAFENCDCEYGAFPYAWTTDVGPALGCTWFRDTFLAKYPDAAVKAGAGRTIWQQFDVILMRTVLARKYGAQPHVHLPAVVHLNEAKKLLPEADPTPLMEVPSW